MAGKKINKKAALIRRIEKMDNPYLRHFIKKYNLNDMDSLVLGGLLGLTNQMSTPIKTTYTGLADAVDVKAMDAYRSVSALHREGIIQYKHDHEYVHISFNKITERVDEIYLARRNEQKIKKIMDQLKLIHDSRYVPREDLFDLIYPVIGKLVTRKIAEALKSLVNYINLRINSTFSIKMIRLRMKALFSGIPLAELVLRDSLPFILEEILIIEKKSSLLISHASRKDEEMIDRDMVGGMLSAINNFISTSFHKKDGDYVNEIQYGDASIMILESRYFYMAQVVHGAPALQYQEDVQSFADTIHKQYRVKLQKFKGNVETMNSIKNELESFINSVNIIPEENEEPSYGKLKAAAVILALTAVLGAGKLIYNAVIDNIMEKTVRDRLAETLPPYSADIIIDVDGDNVMVKGSVSSEVIGKLIDKELKRFSQIRHIHNEVVASNFMKVHEYGTTMEEIRLKIDRLTLEQIRAELEQIIIQFPVNSTALDRGQMFNLRRAHELLIPYNHITIETVAFSDKQGSIDVNRKLAEGRNKSVKKYLISLGLDESRIKIIDYDPDLIESNPRFAKYHNRRGIMLFAKMKEE